MVLIGAVLWPLTTRLRLEFLGDWWQFILGGAEVDHHPRRLLDPARVRPGGARAPWAGCRATRSSTASRRSTCRSSAARRCWSRSSSGPTPWPRPGLVLPLFWAGIVALGVNYGAYMTEIFRAGIQAVPARPARGGRGAGHAGAAHDAPDRAAAGDPDRDPGHRQRVHRDDQGHRRWCPSSASRSCSGGRRRRVVRRPHPRGARCSRPSSTGC